MRSYAWCVGACALLLTGYASSADLTPILYNIGETFEASIETSLLPEGAFSCSLETPSGNIVTLRPEHNGDTEKYALRPFNILLGCAVSVRITDSGDEGNWFIVFTPNGGGESRRTEYKIALNPPDLPRIVNYDSSRAIENLTEEFINTTLGTSHVLKINYYDFVYTESCHIITPEGDEYDLTDIPLENIKVIQDINVACGVEIVIKNESFVGKWMLFSRDKRHSTPIERRLPFTIHIEEVVKAMPKEITIADGYNLHLRLEKKTSFYKTCKLIAPDGKVHTAYKIDENHIEECGFVVPRVQINDSGTWEIVFGQRIIYKAPVQVIVNAVIEEEDVVLNWVRDRPVDELVGPEDTVYCRVADPEGLVVFEGFGRCHITLERVRDHHGGVWLITVSTPGRVLTDEKKISVFVNQAPQHPRVSTSVEAQKPDVLLSCSLEGHHNISSCKFRDPSGRILLATQGVGDDRYSFHGVDVSLESNVASSGCGLRITNPVHADMGLWRCAMETEDGSASFGFLKVVCPFAISQAGAPPVITEPMLSATQHIVETQGTESVTMSCSVESEIRYCYFRARNGTVFSVSPSTESDMMEYVGAGFDAGECGIRFRRLSEADMGQWSCHVGFPDLSLPEQRVSILVQFERPITVSQRHDPEFGNVIVKAQVYDSRRLDYCRYVRIDGLGFTSASLPDQRYSSHDNLDLGRCGLSIRYPTMLDHHPWTVLTLIHGQDVEIYGTTQPTMEMPTSPAPETSSPRPQPPPQPVRFMSMGHMWIVIVLLVVIVTLLGLSITSKRPRQWASRCRDSLRRKKAPLPENPPPNYTP